MKRLALLTALIALFCGSIAIIASPAQAVNKNITHYAPSNCGNPTACGYYDYDSIESSYTYFNVYELAGFYNHAVICCSGHSHYIWEEMNWGPPGCYKTSALGYYTNSNTNTYNAGTLALVNYSCGGRAAVHARMIQSASFQAALAA